MIDTLKKNESKFYPPKIWDHLQLSPQNYFVLTLHRPSNVDNDKLFCNILSEIDHEAKEKHVVYPVHPRVKEKLLESKIKYKNIKLVEPMSYLEFNYLVKNSKGIITDSGGITEEATMYNVPCITLRGNTERLETVDLGTNVLVKKFPVVFRNYMLMIHKKNWKKGNIPNKWDGKAALRISKHIKSIFKLDE
jgi:UDP-N-acetylglucosamine 2-epimerase (non-hydrolysing)